MDKEKITAVYKEYFSDIYRYSLFKLGDKERAEDIASGAFLKLLEHQGEEIENHKAWLITVTRNEIYKQYMRANKSTQLETIDENDLVADEIIETDIADQELIEQAKNEMSNLKEDEQEVLVLKIWEGLKFEEIAKIIDRNINTVKFTYYQALEKLKVALGVRKPSKNLYVLTAPLLAGTIKAVSASYLPSAEVVDSVFSNLFLSNKPMTIVESTTSNMISSITPKIAGLIAAVVIGSTGLGIGATLALTKTKPDPTPTPVVTMAPTVATTVQPTQVLATAEPQQTAVPTPATVTIAFEKSGNYIPVENFMFTFTFENKGYATEVVKENGYAQYLKISGDGFALHLTPEFEGFGLTYEQKQAHTELSTAQFGMLDRFPPTEEMIRSGYYSLNDHYYGKYLEGDDCAIWSPQPPACSTPWITSGEVVFVATCKANASNAYKCDELMQTLIYKSKKI